MDRVECLSPLLVEQQIRAVIEDIPPQAAKTGALGTREIIETIARLAGDFQFPLVVDPVMLSKHGAPLLAPDAVTALYEKLLPHTYLLTPNLPEAAALAGIEVRNLGEMRAAAERLVAAGARNVLIKGGHLTDTATDLLLYGGEWFEFPAQRLETHHTHGTGCTYSAAITAQHLPKASRCRTPSARPKSTYTRPSAAAPTWGMAPAPVNHFAQSWNPRSPYPDHPFKSDLSRT